MEHAHCYKCISLSCTTYEGCPIEACPEPGCGVRLHGCKLEDHLSVCWYAVMPCTNATYGCSARLPRHQLAAHLPTCSASVIVCMRHSHEDYIRTDGAQSPAYQSVFRRDEFSSHSADVHDCLELAHDDVSANSSRHCPYRQYGCEYTLDRLKPLKDGWSVVYDKNEELFAVRYENGHTEGEGPISENDSSPASPTGVTSSSSQDRPGLHRVFSREEELKFYGYEEEYVCGEEVDVEATPPAALSREQELALYGYGQVKRTQPATLDGMPPEVLLILVQHLDSISLRSLSLVSWHFREICQSLLASRGIVLQPWMRSQDATAGWTETSYRVRIFTTATHSVGSRRWRWSKDAFQMAVHLAAKHREIENSHPREEFSEDDGEEKPRISSMGGVLMPSMCADERK